MQNTLCVATDRAVNETFASFSSAAAPENSCAALSLMGMFWFRVAVAGTLSQLPVVGMQRQPLSHHMCKVYTHRN